MKNINFSKILIADMCFHQVMAECMYQVFSRIFKTHILSNEPLMEWPKIIPLRSITILYKANKNKSNPIITRTFRLFFFVYLLFVNRKYNYILLTSSIEYSPFLVRTLSYFLLSILCKIHPNVFIVIHNTKRWKDISNSSMIKRKLLNSIFTNAGAFACLSKLTLNKWKSLSLSNRPSFRLPFLTINKQEIKPINMNVNSEKIILVFQGTVNWLRKDTNELYKAVLALSKNERKRYKFIFQGPPIYDKDRQFLREFSLLVDCDWRDYFLPYDKMEQLISKSHLFICPVKKATGYGKYKESGIGFDCIRYQKGALVKKGICSEEFKEMSLEYETIEELVNFLRSIDKNLIKELNKKVAQISLKFTNSYWSERIKLMQIFNI